LLERPLSSRPRFEKIQCSESLRSSHVLDAATGEGIDQHVKTNTDMGEVFELFLDCRVVSRGVPSRQLIYAAVNFLEFVEVAWVRPIARECSKRQVVRARMPEGVFAGVLWLTFTVDAAYLQRKFFREGLSG
jgi:hypothetical protein